MGLPVIDGLDRRSKAGLFLLGLLEGVTDRGILWNAQRLTPFGREVWKEISRDGYELTETDADQAIKDILEGNLNLPDMMESGLEGTEYGAEEAPEPGSAGNGSGTGEADAQGGDQAGSDPAMVPPDPAGIEPGPGPGG